MDKSDPRTRYLEIATRNFAELGFHGVSLATLAREAGVSKQALLHFFASKERLYAAVLDRLSEDLCAAVDAVEAAGPEARLVAHFEDLARGGPGRASARLVVRALLESDPAARFWPLKRYLDKVTGLVGETAGGRDLSEDARAMGVFQLMGSIHYYQISEVALVGMYGAAQKAAFDTRLVEAVSREVRALVEG